MAEAAKKKTKAQLAVEAAGQKEAADAVEEAPKSPEEDGPEGTEQAEELWTADVEQAPEDGDDTAGAEAGADAEGAGEPEPPAPGPDAEDYADPVDPHEAFAAKEAEAQAEVARSIYPEGKVPDHLRIGPDGRLYQIGSAWTS